MGDDMDRTKGRVKQAAGDLTGDQSLKNEGKADEAGAGIKEKVGDAVDKVKDVIHKD